MAGQGRQRLAAFGGLSDQGVALRHGGVQAVDAAMGAAGALVLPQGVDVGGLFDLRAAVEAARMAGDQRVAIEHANLAQAGVHRERAAHVGVRDGVVVAIEADVGGLADLRLD